MAIGQESKLPNTIDELLAYLQTSREALGINDNEVKLIWMAYNFAKSAHEGQLRGSGEPYIIHPLNIARILLDMGFDAETIAAGFLHDVVEDTPITIEQIQEQFGMTIAALVDGVTKLSKYDLPDKTKRDAQAIRKLFLAMISDARVIVIKLADRLHNLQTLESVSNERKKNKAVETLEIYAPIAERLGIWKIKGELEDLSFRYLDPGTYNVLAQGLQKSVGAHEQILNTIIQTTIEKMGDIGFVKGTFEVTGRQKYIYSVYKKMQTPKYEGQGIDRIYDKLGIRIIVQTIQDCYSVLGLIHSQWQPIHGEFDDYIGMRLPSGYQSLHTTVKYGSGKNDVVEFQIRTYQMHRDAEYGIAAHWLYKEKSHQKRDAALEQKIQWLRQMLEEPQSDDPEYLSRLKAEILQDHVYVFTPNGDIIDLPSGSTPIDFAYSVHTDIGHHCRGAKVNGKLVPLDSTLNTGDQVTILTAKHGGPSRDWLNPNLGLVATQRARAKIRQWFKRQDREQNLTQGKSILDKEFHRLGLRDFDMNILLQAFDYKSLDDLYVGLGCGDISLKKIISTLSDVDKEKEAILEPTTQQPIPRDGNGVAVLGLKGLLSSFAKCCNPAPGDEIVGYITRGRGATIHRQDCPNILRLNQTDRERLVVTSWGEPLRTYPVAVEIKAYDRQGLMGDISTVLKEESVNIQSVEVKVNHNLATIILVLEIGDIAQLSKVLTRIENLPNILESHRIRPG